MGRIGSHRAAAVTGVLLCACCDLGARATTNIDRTPTPYTQHAGLTRVRRPAPTTTPRPPRAFAKRNAIKLLNEPQPSVIERDANDHTLPARSHNTGSGITPVVKVTATDGYRGDVTVGSVYFGPGLELNDFITAQRAEHIHIDGNPDAVRIVRGPTATAPTPTMTVGAFDGTPSLLSREDMTRAAKPLAAAATSTNLNQLIDIEQTCEFSMDLIFDVELEDNCAGPDILPELICFERSAGRAGDAITIQAVDENGLEVGSPIVVGAEPGTDCTPRADAAVYDRKLKLAGYESVTFVPVDLSTLGVTSAKRIRVRTPRAGDHLPDGTPFTGAPGQPDFKVLALRTSGAALPDWMMGD